MSGENFTGAPRWHFSSKNFSATSRFTEDRKQTSEEVMLVEFLNRPRLIYLIFSTEDIHENEISTECIFLYHRGPRCKFKQTGSNIFFTEAGTIA